MKDVRNEIEIQMTPLVKSPDPDLPLAPLLYPNPCRGELNVLMPEGFSGMLNIKVFGREGKLFINRELEAVEGEPLKLDCRRLDDGEYVILFTDLSTGRSATGKIVILML
jgi:hypothetical protein